MIKKIYKKIKKTIKNCLMEFRRIKWLSFPQLIKNTAVIIGIIAVFCLFFFISDAIVAGIYTLLNIR